MKQIQIYCNKTFAKKVLGSIAIFLLVFTMIICSTLIIHAEESESAPMIVDVGNPILENPELFLPRTMPTHGKGKIAVFLIDFPDYRNDDPNATREYFDKIYFSGGIETNWGYETVASFFKKQSFGKLTISGKVFDWYTAKHERSYYDNRKAELIMEAAEHYISKGTNFSQFDGNLDGIIDAITFHFAGETTKTRHSPWYSGVCFSNDIGYGKIQGLLFKTIVQIRAQEESETGILKKSVSIICHELMHTLGLPDLYSELGDGCFPVTDVMGENLITINPYTKILLGWIDKVTVITSDATNVRLDPYENDSPGDIVIVTNEFNGFFDEFFLVAYRDFKPHINTRPQAKTAVVYHIDARLTETGDSFKYNNLYYNPRPDRSDEHHNNVVISKYLFIEELSGNPEYNHVLNNVGYLDMLEFGEDSVLGPDSIPSSDTHDGDYTGIRIDNFIIHNREYLTFDVAFVTDNNSPIVTTKPEKMEFKDTIKIHFNERIYSADNWANIQVTDLNGNPIEATAFLPNCPHHEMEITFKNDSYKNGYKVILPEGCLRDSSDNLIEATVITASSERIILPIRETQLSDINNNLKRDTLGSFFFTTEDNIIVMNRIIEKLENNQNLRDAKLEFVRFDRNGKVITQTIVDNPFKGVNVAIRSIIQTEDDCYIVFLTNAGVIEHLFCIDPNGSIKWTKDFHGTGSYFIPYDTPLCGNYSALYYDGHRYSVRINSDTGEIEFIADINKTPYNFGFSLPNGKSICLTGNLLRIIDTETRKLDKEKNIEGIRNLRQATINDDGTIMLYGTDYNGDANVFLLDAELNIIKKAPLTNRKQIAQHDLYFFDNDGFCDIVPVEIIGHGNDGYHVYRYDRYMNLIWETDILANFIYYFKSSSGDLLAYKSVYGKGCFIEFYGSEDSYKSDHIHNLVHIEEKAPRCLKEGRAEYWYCSDCGCMFSDNGENVVTDTSTLIIPSLGGHTISIIEAISPTCSKTGLTEGKYCSVCDQIITKQLVVPALKHTIVTDEAIVPTCIETGLSKGKHCSVCGAIIVQQNIVPKLDHIEVTDKAVYSTCTETGLTEGKHCSVCETIIVQQNVIPKLDHTEVTIAAVAPTCIRNGLTEGQYCSICNTVINEQSVIPATGEHEFGEWLAAESTNKEIRICNLCNYEDVRLIESPTETVSNSENVTETFFQEPVIDSGCNSTIKFDTLIAFAIVSALIVAFRKKGDR